MTVRTALLSLVFALTVPIATQPLAHGLSQLDMDDLSYAYTYVQEQEALTQYVVATYPTLAPEVKAWRRAFEDRYPNAKGVLRAHMKHFSITDADIDRAFPVPLTTYHPEVAVRSEAEARAMLADWKTLFDGQEPVDERATRVISDVVYADAPEKEFHQSYQLFSSDGHEKSQGVDATLQVPRSFASDADNGPDGVQHWVKVDERTAVGVVLSIADASTLPAVFGAAWSSDLSPGDWRRVEDQLFPRQYRVRLGEHQLITVPQQKALPALLLDGVVKRKAGGRDFIMHQTTLVTRVSRQEMTKVVFLNTFVAVEKEAELTAAEAKYAPLFDLVRQSLTVRLNP